MLFWVWILTAMASFRIRRGDELFGDGGFDTQVKFQILTWGLLGLVAVWLVVKQKAALRLLQGGPLMCYAIFVAAALFSVCVSPAPTMTAFRALQHGIALVLVISLRDNLKRMVAFIAMYIAINWLLLILAVTGLDFGQEWIAFYVRDQSFLSGDFMHRWRFTTAYGHPSWISIIAAVGAISLAARTRGHAWRTSWPLFALFILTTILTVSRTAIFGLGVGLAIVALGRRQVFMSLVFVMLPSVMLLVSPEVRETIAHYLQRGQTADELAEFTGRAGVYQVAIDRIQHSLPFGEGFQSGRVNPLEEDNETMAHAHNLLLEATAGTGFVGGLAVALAIVLWVAQLHWLLMHSPSGARRDRAWELTAIAAPLLAFCVLDSGFSNCIHQVTFFYLIAMARTQTAVLEQQPTSVKRPTLPTVISSPTRRSHA
jgi:O-antigen ligase